MPRKKEVNLARILYRAYPHSDLLPIDPRRNCSSLLALTRKVVREDCGDTLFKFLAVEMLEGGDGTLEGAIRVVERAKDDVEAVLTALVKERRESPNGIHCPHVAISVAGGVADVASKSGGVAVSIFDYDVEGADPSDARLSRGLDGRACFLTEWPASDVVT